MDMYRNLLTVVLCIGLLQSVAANCQNNLMQNQAFLECFQGFSVFMGNVASNPQMLCSAEGQAATKCIFDFWESCPDISTMPGMGTMSQALSNMKTMCGGSGGGGSGRGDMSGSGGAGGEACMAAQECMKFMSGMGMSGGPPPEGPEAGLVSFQKQVSNLCGPMKNMLDCLERVETGCPQIVESMKQSFSSGSGPGQPDMSYEKITSFTKDYCSTIPSDFGENQCVARKLKSAANDTCFTDAMQGSQGPPTCSQVKQFLGCIGLKKCGDQYPMAFRKVMSFFLTTEMKTCDLTSGMNTKVAKGDTSNTGNSNKVVNGDGNTGGDTGYTSNTWEMNKEAPVVIFNAHTLNNTTPSDGEVLVFENVMTNIGSCYNEDDGRFTAPVNGTYAFTVQLCMASRNGYIHFAVVKSTGEALIQSQISRNSPYSRPFENCDSLSIFAVLDAGESVWVESNRRSAEYSDASDLWNYFSGVLLKTM